MAGWILQQHRPKSLQADVGRFEPSHTDNANFVLHSEAQRIPEHRRIASVFQQDTITATGQIAAAIDKTLHHETIDKAEAGRPWIMSRRFQPLRGI